MGYSSASLGIEFELVMGQRCTQKFFDPGSNQEKICKGQIYIDGNCYVCVGCFKSVRIDEAPPIADIKVPIDLFVPKKDYPQKEKKPTKQENSSAKKMSNSPMPKTGYQKPENGNGKKKNGNGRKKSTTKVKNPSVVQSRQSAKAEIKRALEEFYF